MTGADEHGQKIAQKAEDEGVTPQQLVDRYADGFQALNQRLNTSEDFYVRTSQGRHKEVARKLWEKCKEVGDIYLDRYEGWYLVREERFITEQEAQEWDYKDPLSAVPLKKMSEPSFFFRLSKYQKRVVQHIEDNKDFIHPEQYRTEILERLRSIELRDLSISRGTFDWGIECPEPLVDGKQHVMYVWFDALINYVSGVDGHDKSKPLSRFWPADMHVIGKDICWFHCVIWPSMLMSVGLPIPKSVVVHGFIAGPDGRKMSKTFGNVVDPHDQLDRYPTDTLRWFLCREAEYGDDLKFSEDSLKLMHNADLCDKLGNLVHRAVTLCGGSIPEADFKLTPSLPFDLKEMKTSVRGAFERYRLAEAATLVASACGATNKWIADLEPWKMKADSQQALRAICLRLLLEAVYVLAHFFTPFIPTAGDAIFKKLGCPPRPIGSLSDSFQNLSAGGQVKSDSILFEQLEVKAPEAKASESKADAAAKAKPKAKAKGAPSAVDDPTQPLFSKLDDVRVGKVVKAWHHPEADKLFCEEIDVGDPEGPRQIVSGLRDHYTLEQFEGRLLLAVCNMKPSKLRNVMSSGMVLCAKNPDAKVVELLSVPDGCSVGDRVLPEGVPTSWSPMDPDAVKKFKIWEQVAEGLKSNAERVACHDGKPLVTGSGARFVAPTQAGAPIS
ncbi:unnamed protein product [Prorocentrum cordatum]|uniref:methionine--tRNA ligase n=1 Tax=Prorocentrum cordatum TaxID=2364126 RepID=A0ABN9TLV6_9DINO|nr:unnamed protein product [Polarella glacialis]